MALICGKVEPLALFQRCQFSVSSIVYSRKIKKPRKLLYPDLKTMYQHMKILPKKHPELYAAQQKRRQWDYPLGDDKRAAWDHKIWYDPFLNKWVASDKVPDPKKKDFSLYEKEMRGLIHEQNSVENKFLLLLDRDFRKKYVLPAFNMEFPRNASYFYQHATKTKFVHGVPYIVDSIKIDDSAIEEFERFLTTLLQLELFFNPKTSNEKVRKNRADRVLSGILQQLMNQTLHDDFHDCEFERAPENSMFWQRSRGFYKYTMRPDLPLTFQSHDTPLYQIRTKKPLSEFSPWMEDFMLTGEIPRCEYLPYVYGIQRKAYRNTIAPGFRFKAGDVILNYQEALEQGKLMELPPPVTSQCQYGHTQFISLPEKFSREWYEANLEHCDISDEMEEHIKAHGIMSGWTWSAGLAHYMGHWMDNDVDAPLCVQSVISDGKYFSFFCYQLNTVAIDPENEDTGENQRRNICYGTPMMKLYDTVEGTDDIQLHQDTTKLLLKFILNNSRNAANRDDVVEHNSSLEVQEWDAEKPEIALQVPKHVRDRLDALEIAKQEEIESKKGVTGKIIDWIKS